MDSFRGHKSDDVNEQLENIDYYTYIIHGGFTSILQPLYFGINKPFKDYLRNEFLTFYNNFTNK